MLSFHYSYVFGDPEKNPEFFIKNGLFTMASIKFSRNDWINYCKTGIITPMHLEYCNVLDEDLYLIFLKNNPKLLIYDENVSNIKVVKNYNSRFIMKTGVTWKILKRYDVVAKIALGLVLDVDNYDEEDKKKYQSIVIKSDLNKLTPLILEHHYNGRYKFIEEVDESLLNNFLHQLLDKSLYKSIFNTIYDVPEWILNYIMKRLGFSIQYFPQFNPSLFYRTIPYVISEDYIWNITDDREWPIKYYYVDKYDECFKRKYEGHPVDVTKFQEFDVLFRYEWKSSGHF